MPDTTPTDTGNDAKAVQALKKACDDAYAKHNNSCSHAVWYIITQVAEPAFQWNDANGLIDYWIASSGWKEVSLDDGWQLAQKGIVVCGGLKKTGGHGHVIAIYPGEKKASGGYLYTYTDKKTGKLLTDTMRSHGNYPRALSTSIGTWPGAKSMGDKTVWDPWASDDVFADVDFWTKVTG